MTGDTFLISSFPFGRGKPSLHDILTRPPTAYASSSKVNHTYKTPEEIEATPALLQPAIEQLESPFNFLRPPSGQEEETEFYFFLLNIGTCTESKLKMYLSMILQIDSAQLLLNLVSFGAERGAFLLKTFSLESKPT